MSTYYQIDCPTCYNKNDINDMVCSTCGLQIPGTINIRRASLPIEVNALEKRYLEATNYLIANQLEKERQFLENEVATNGKSVINTDFDFLWEWLIRGKFSYQSYRRQLINSSRLRAKFENDRQRCIADSILFGSAIDIIYAALSIDETGISSYGDIILVLKTKSIENRISALEKNSFIFIDEISKGGWIWREPIPAGYMCTWPNNYKLALAKIHQKVNKGLNVNQLAKLVLYSTGNRTTDEFIELYIYGKVVASVIEKVRIPLNLITSFNAKQKAQLKELQNKFLIETF